MGIIIGCIITYTAFGYVQMSILPRYSANQIAWAIVAITTVNPLLEYVRGHKILKGQYGGFIQGLGVSIAVVSFFTQQ